MDAARCMARATPWIAGKPDPTKAGRVYSFETGYLAAFTAAASFFAASVGSAFGSLM